jgi:hypothetical protein
VSPSLPSDEIALREDATDKADVIGAGAVADPALGLAAEAVPSLGARLPGTDALQRMSVRDPRRPQTEDQFLGPVAARADRSRPTPTSGGAVMAGEKPSLANRSSGRSGSAEPCRFALHRMTSDPYPSRFGKGLPGARQDPLHA